MRKNQEIKGKRNYEKTEIGNQGNYIDGDIFTAYYPDLKQLGETISPLKEKVNSIQEARAANAEIMGIRDALLK